MIEQVDLQNEHIAIREAFDFTNKKLRETPSKRDGMFAPFIRVGFIKGYLLKSLQNKEIDPFEWLEIEDRHREIEKLLKSQQKDK